MVKLTLKRAYRMVLGHTAGQWKCITYTQSSTDFHLCSIPKLFTAVTDGLATFELLSLEEQDIHHYLPLCTEVYLLMQI